MSLGDRPAIAIRLGACALFAIAGLVEPPDARGQAPADTVACRFDGPPIVTSLSYPEARRVLQRCRFVADSVGRLSSERPGTVLDQRTIPREDDVGDRHVELVVAVPPPAPVDTMPRLVGRSRSAAERLAVLFKLRPRYRERPSESTPSGVVDAQRPSSGADVPNGRMVDVWISTGPAGVPVPDLGDRTVGEARRILDSAGLEFAGSRPRESDRPEGRIVGQAPPPDSIVPRGSPVAVFVSSGPRPVLVPPVLDLTLRAADSTLAAHGLSLGMVGSEPDSNRVEGTVARQDPEAGGEVRPGTAVALVLAARPPAPPPPAPSQTSEPPPGEPPGGPDPAASDPTPAPEPRPAGGRTVVALPAPDLTGLTLAQAAVRAGRNLRVAVDPAVSWPGDGARIGAQRPGPGVVLAGNATILVTPEHERSAWLLVLLGTGVIGVIGMGGRAVKHRLWPRIAVRPIPGMIGPAVRVADPEDRVERTIRLRFDGGPTVSRIRRSGATDGS